MTTRTFLAASAVLVLIGLAPTALFARDGRRPVTTAAVATIDLIGVTQTGKDIAGPRFSVAELRDLLILTRWNIPGAHVQRLDVRAPGGKIYQRLSKPFGVDRGTGPQRRGGYRGTAVETVLPVGGTWITEYALVGEWQIDVYLDDDRTPVATRSFLLKP